MTYIHAISIFIFMYMSNQNGVKYNQRQSISSQIKVTEYKPTKSMSNSYQLYSDWVQGKVGQS